MNRTVGGAVPDAVSIPVLTTLLLLGNPLAARAGEVPGALTTEDWAEIRTHMAGDPEFAQQAYLKASNTGVTDNFGHAVAVSGDLVVVGTWREDSSTTGVDSTPDDLADAAGAAYVFRRTGGKWVQDAYLKASNTEAGDRFGWSVAIAGNTIVVGAWAESSSTSGVNSAPDNAAAEAGAAYVFRRGGGKWTQEAYLKASNTGADDEFGASVAISGDTIVVGAPNEDGGATGVNGPDNDETSRSGAAYVFKRSGGTWAQQAYLKSSNTGTADNFGNAVAISGDTIVVGARNEDTSATGIDPLPDNRADFSGAAYVFQRNGGTWSQQAFLKASNTGFQDHFGASVGISGDTIVVGANREDSSTREVDGVPDDDLSEAGAAYVFHRDNGTWAQQAFLKSANIDQGDEFGEFVAISGDTVVVGTRKEDGSATGVNGGDDNEANVAGAAYAFTRTGGTWTQSAYLKASNTGASDAFGSAVAIDGDTIVVGALNERSNATGVDGDESNNSAAGAGAAYVFVDASSVAINAGMNDAWFNAATTGQGFFIIVFPDTGIVFLAWFTYDTERPPEDVEAILGEVGHRWLTAQGPFAGDTATLDLFLTEGGVFDMAEPEAVTGADPVGSITIVWHDCGNATLSYDLPVQGLMGEIPLTRIVPDNVPLCEVLSGQ